MAQTARPDADLSDGTWTNQVGSNVNLFANVDESSADDADYIRTAGIVDASETCLLGLSDVTDPSSSSGHIVRWRARVANWVDDAITLNIALRQGGVVIATARSGAITDTSFTSGSYTLSGAEADAISNYANLNLQINKTNPGGDDGTVNVQVSWLEFEVPDVAGSSSAGPLVNGGVVNSRKLVGGSLVT